MRPFAVALVVVALVLTPLGLALPAPAPAAEPALSAVPSGLLAAAQARDARGVLTQLAALPGVDAIQAKVLEHYGATVEDPTLDRLVAVGELYFVGHPLATPDLAVPDVRTAFLGLYAAAGATPDGPALAALDAFAALPADAQQALARLAAAQTYALEQARVAYAGLTPGELALLRTPFAPEELHARVAWTPLFLGLRAQLAAAEAAVPVLGTLAPQPTTLATCDVVVVNLGDTDDTYQGCDYLLLLDTAGDDTYLNNAGGTGASKVPVSALLLDLAGNDLYAPMLDGTGGVVGGGVTGGGLVYDVSGDDRYTPGFVPEVTQGTIVGAIGGGSAGLGALVDRDGSDVYSVHGPWYAGAIGGGRSGYGLLVDRGLQTDVYEADLESAGGAFGGADRGTGVLLDEGGDEHYMGMMMTRVGVEGGFNGGGIGNTLLIDQGGNDEYMGELMGLTMGTGGINGGSWGVHGVGLLYDAVGDDVYMGVGMMDSETNGGGGGGAIGVLLDFGGDDHASGVADMTGTVNGGGDLGIGALINVGGDDVYDALFCNPEMGGINGGAWAGVGLLLDLGGTDLYRDRVEHHHMPMADSMGLMCMMMPMDSESGAGDEGIWYRDSVQFAKGNGHPINIPTGLQIDDTAAIVLGPGGPLPAPEQFSTDERVLLSQGDDLVLQPPALGHHRPHGAAEFRGLPDFTAGNGVKTGRGTAAEPFVISGWIFPANPLGPSVAFRGTDLHVVLRDNVFLGGLPAVLVEDARNLVVEQNVCTGALACVAVHGGQAVLRDNTFLRSERGVEASMMARVSLDHNDLVGNTVGVHFDGSDVTLTGNEVVANGEGLHGMGGLLKASGNNFRLNGGGALGHRQAAMLEGTMADLCGNWWSHPDGPRVQSVAPPGPPVNDPQPAAVQQYVQDLAVRALPFAGETVVSTLAPRCLDSWLQAPAMAGRSL